MAHPSTMPASQLQRATNGGNGHDSARRASKPSLPGISTGLAIRVQMTPPETPVSQQGAADWHTAPALFHNYLRAFYPFDPTSASLQGDDAQLMTAAIKPGDLILVHSVHANGWADGTVLTTGDRGWLPTNYCEPYDHPYVRNLLNAMTQFYDLLGASEDANFSTFVRQDYIRGLIAGVRYLLEHADCLHRDAKLVQKHAGIRRMRKGLLADLSTLVQIARGLQETMSEPFAAEVIHYLLEDLITKAFKVVARAVGFADIWTSETSDKSEKMDTQLPGQAPATPPLDQGSLAVDTRSLLQSNSNHPIDSAIALPDQHEPTKEGDAITGAEDDTHRIDSHQTPLASEPRKSWMAHRLSLVSRDRVPANTLASQQLAKLHDRCISHIGAFIGHHIHSRPSSELVETTEKLVKSSKGLLAVVDEVLAHESERSTPVQQARANFQSKLEDLVKATKDVFRFNDADDGDVVMLPDQTERLVTVGTGLIRTAGECVARTRALIEQIGDFEFEGVKEPSMSSKRTSRAISVGPSKIPERSTSLNKVEMGVTTSLEKRLSTKILPPLPPSVPKSWDKVETAEPAIGSPTAASDMSSPMTPFSPESQESLPALPSMHRRSAIRLSQQIVNSVALRSQRSSVHDGVKPVRKDSVGLSIAGSTDTYRSSTRDSGITGVSEVSTRATTPDHHKYQHSPDAGFLTSFTSMSSMRSEVTDAANDTETQLLAKTYATELTLNKDGQVTGGSLPALVEQLTTHDSAPDPQFVSAFYLTFRMFTTPRDFAQALIARFDYVGDSKDMGTPVRLRIYNVFKGWLETYWNNEADKDALGDIRYFAMHKLKPLLPSAGERLLDLTRKVTTIYQNGTTVVPLVSGVGKSSLSLSAQDGLRANTPEPLVNKSQLNSLMKAANGGPPCNALELDPLELARQATLMASKIFCAIRPEELLSLDWGKSDTTKAPNVRAMCTYNTDLAHVVGDSILMPEDAKRRAQVIKQWSKTAACCLELNYYDSLMAIMCSINSSVVSRLRRTWELVSKKTKARLTELNAVVDFSRNQASLRRRLETLVAPCTPFLGIYLTDLTFLDAGNPKTRELPGATSENGQRVSVINFDKYMRMAKVISHLQKFQLPYNLKPVPEMQAWMDMKLHKMREHNDEMVGHFHRRSLLVEPKHEPIKPLKTADGNRTDSGLAEDRPKTGNKEKLEKIFKANGFNF